MVEPAKLRRIEDVALLVGAAVASVAYGLTFGFTYGVNNQTEYMLGALRLLDPSVLGNDWFAAHTLNYHPVFAYVGWLLLAVGGRGGWGVGISTVVCAAGGAMCVYWLARRLLPRPLAAPTFLLTVAAMAVTGTRELAGTYVFDPIFQPSTLSTVALLGAIAAFVDGRALLSGVLLAVAGAIHANFLVLGLGVFALATLAAGRDDLRRRALRQLGPAALVLLLMSPVIFRAVHGGADVAKAQQILFDIRSPHHYHPRNWVGDFFPFALWQTLGLSAGAWVLRLSDGRGRRFGAIVGSLLVVVWAGTVLSVVFDVHRATQMFVWRLAPFIDLLMELLIAATVVRMVVSPDRPPRVGLAGLGVVVASAAALLLASIRSEPLASYLEWLAVGACAALLAHGVASGMPIAGRAIARWSRHAHWAALAVSALLLVTVVRDPLRTMEHRSNLLTGMPGVESDLYAWIRANTPKDAVFLSPPGLERFRLGAERPIVVDWKAVTYVPAELLEWYARLEDVSGRRGPRSREEVVDGYEALDQARLNSLRQKYGLSYAVVTRSRAAALARPVVYENQQFAVLDLRVPGA